MTVVVTDERGRPVRARGLASWLKRAAPRRAGGTVSVAIVSDARVRALNARYRQKNYATDVLSFPTNAGLQPCATTETVAQSFRAANPFLGDIVIARGVARRQARAAGHSAMVELRILALHGLLHLLGYDHERDDGRMRMVEQRLLHKAGLGRGLIERARPSTLRRAQRRPEPRRGTTGSGRAQLPRIPRRELVEPRATR